MSKKVKTAIGDIPTIKLNNGENMPAFGLGTYASVGKKGVDAIKYAIDIGYRHFDTAYLYGNENEIGEAINAKIEEGVIQRSDVFVVTKLWCNFHEPSQVERICKKSLENLGLDYIDLYLMHFPIAFVYNSDEDVWPKNPDGTQAVDNSIDYVDTWKAMEQLVEKGYVRSLGVSNFNSEQIERILSTAAIKPVTNQVECSPVINQRKLIKFCKEKDIVITSYCPLSIRSGPPPEYMVNPKVKEIADKYKKTTTQIGLRYLVDLGTIPIPKSVTNERIKENIDIFDFKLTEDEIKIMDEFSTGQRIVNMVDSKHSIHWPFGLEF